MTLADGSAIDAIVVSRRIEPSVPEAITIPEGEYTFGLNLGPIGWAAFFKRADGMLDTWRVTPLGVPPPRSGAGRCIAPRRPPDGCRSWCTSCRPPAPLGAALHHV